MARNAPPLSYPPSVDTSINEESVDCRSEICGIDRRGAKKQCFVAGTLVATAKGLMPIETIQEGDWVYAKHEITRDIGLKPVTHLTITPNNRNAGEIVLENEQGIPETHGASSEQLYFVVNQGWVEAQHLKIGMLVENLSGRLLKVTQSWAHAENATTYNFEVEKYHTYFVGLVIG